MDESELRAAVEALEDEAAGKPFTSSQRNRWNDLNEQLDEYKVRRDRLREFAGNPRASEDGAAFHVSGPRSDESSPAHVRAAHDAGLRAIERNRGVLSPEAGDRLDTLVRTGDPVGIGARYLDAVSTRTTTARSERCWRTRQRGICGSRRRRWRRSAK